MGQIALEDPVGQKNVQNFVGFVEYGRTLYFAFETYWPLGNCKIIDLSNATFSKLGSNKCPFFNMEKQFIDQNVRKVLTTVQFWEK